MYSELKHFYLAVLIAAFGVVSCNRLHPQEQQRIIFSVNGFQDFGEDGAMTRTSLKNGTDFIWTANDTVGIYPNTGGQVYFAMTAGAGTKYASFDGGGWDFKPSAVYYSYYPFVGDIYLDRNHIPVSYLGQHQPTATDIEHISPFDFMATPASSASDGKLLFSYSHLNCLIRVTATLPAGTYSKMSITSPDEDFTTRGYYNLASESPSIIPTEKSNQLSITLGDITLSATGTLVVYLMSAPVNLKGKEITVCFNTLSGTKYTQTKTPSRQYEAETIGGLTCDNLVRSGDYSNGVGVDNTPMEDDDETLTIQQ
jgi:hypothetical protein